jgi:hypothetical protein
MTFEWGFKEIFKTPVVNNALSCVKHHTDFVLPSREDGIEASGGDAPHCARDEIDGAHGYA